MADTLTTYTGNVGLGAGSNPNISVISPNANLDTLNQTASQLRNLDYDQNIKLFQQKINDRDTLRQMLEKGLIASGEIDTQDRPAYDQAEKETSDAFDKIGSLNNSKGIEEFYKKAIHANNIVNHAQERNLSLKALEKLKSEATLPFQQKEIQKFIDDQRKKPFEDRIDPYQQTATLDTDAISKLAVTTPIQYSTDEKGNKVQYGLGISNFDGTQFDYDATLKNLQNKYLEVDKDYFYQSQLLNSVEKLPLEEKQKAIAAINERVQQYNTDFNKDISPLTITETGHIQATPTDFSAKWVLAHQPAFETGGFKFNDKFGTYKINLSKAGVDAFYKRAMAGAAQTKAGAYAANIRSQIKARETVQEQDDFLNQLYTRNLVQQPSLIQEMGGNRRDFKKIEAQNSLPVFTLEGKSPVQLIPIGATLDPITKTYKGGYYEPQYMLDGKPVNVKQVSDLYKKFKNVAGSSWNQSFDDFVKQAVEAGKFKVLLRGANGTTDQDLSRAAQQIISNVNTKKGQEGIFENPPIDEQVPEQPELPPQE